MTRNGNELNFALSFLEIITVFAYCMWSHGVTILQREKKNFLGKLKLETLCMQRIQCRPSSCNRVILKWSAIKYPWISNESEPWIRHHGMGIQRDWTDKEIYGLATNCFELTLSVNSRGSSILPRDVTSQLFNGKGNCWLLSAPTGTSAPQTHNTDYKLQTFRVQISFFLSFPEFKANFEDGFDCIYTCFLNLLRMSPFFLTC